MGIFDSLTLERKCELLLIEYEKLGLPFAVLSLSLACPYDNKICQLPDLVCLHEVEDLEVKRKIIENYTTPIAKNLIMAHLNCYYQTKAELDNMKF